MRIGLALPQFDYSVPGESPLQWDTLADHARAVERFGFDSLWLCDHIGFDPLARRGGGPIRYAGFEPLAALGALSRVVTRARLGTLVLNEGLRHPSLVAKSVAALDRLSGGRVDLGLGAGWDPADYRAIGTAMPSAGVRIARLREAVLVCRGLLSGEPFTFAGRHYHVTDAVCSPAAVQRPAPPIVIGGSGDRLLDVVAELADVWNVCWAWTPDQYLERAEALERALERAGRDPATIARSVGLYALCGEDERDLARRFDRVAATTPAGVLDGMTLDRWREGHLVGTAEQVREQAAGWASLGVDTLILGAAGVSFSVTALDDVELLACALAEA